MPKTRVQLEAELEECLRRQRRSSLEGRVERAERRYDELLRHMPDGCALHEIVTDEQGRPVDYRFLAANEAFGRLTGLDPAAVIGRTVREVLPAIEQAWIEKFGNVALTGVPMHFEQHSGPLERDYEVTAFSPEPRKFIVVFDDVTDRKRLATQLRQAQKMEAVGQLAGGIAHDFRNILTIILALGESVAEALPPQSAGLRADLADLLAAARRGTEITQKLLGFSRMERLALQRVDLRTVVTEVAGILRRLLPATVTLDVRVPAGLAVRADPGALHHVLVNLANNARDAMPDGGTLSLGADAEPARRPDGRDYIRLRVRDSGVGMDRVTVERIFDPFFTTKPAGQGTGLGMPMVLGLLREQGGAIEVESEPGRGTEVRLYLLPDTSGAAAAEPAAREGTPRGSETVLLAEDEASLRAVARRALERLGYRVLTAGDGEEALRLFYAHERDIALVISDSVMPNLGGADLYDALRHHEPPIRFLMCSGYSPPSAGGEREPSARIPFLRKPWTVAELARKVREVLDGA